MRVLRTLRNLFCEAISAYRVTAGPGSGSRLALDFGLYRLLRIWPSFGAGRERTVRFRNGAVITYRLNRGDIQGIREVFLDEAYRLPFDSCAESLIDLGANIGLTSVWLAKTYGCHSIVAVEPDPDNVQLVMKNFRDNGIPAAVLEAAIGELDGTARFAQHRESNLGGLADVGREVRMVSMPTLLDRFKMLRHVDVLKVDIEGGEQRLFSGDLAWLRRVKGIIAEFHPERVDYPGLVRTIEGEHFTYLPPSSVFRNNMDAFVNDEPAPSPA